MKYTSKLWNLHGNESGETHFRTLNPHNYVNESGNRNTSKALNSIIYCNKSGNRKIFQNAKLYTATSQSIEAHFRNVELSHSKKSGNRNTLQKRWTLTQQQVRQSKHTSETLNSHIATSQANETHYSNVKLYTATSQAIQAHFRTMKSIWQWVRRNTFENVQLSQGKRKVGK